VDAQAAARQAEADALARIRAAQIAAWEASKLASQQQAAALKQAALTLSAAEVRQMQLAQLQAQQTAQWKAKDAAAKQLASSTLGTDEIVTTVTYSAPTGNIDLQPKRSENLTKAALAQAVDTIRNLGPKAKWPWRSSYYTTSWPPEKFMTVQESGFEKGGYLYQFTNSAYDNAVLLEGKAKAQIAADPATNPDRIAAAAFWAAALFQLRDYVVATQP
jgi:hypothetical protein